MLSSSTPAHKGTEGVDFKNELDAVLRTFAEQLGGLVRRYEAAVLAPEPPPTAPTPVPAHKSGSGPRRLKAAQHAAKRRTKATVNEQTIACVMVIQKHPRGIRAADIATETRIPRGEIGVPLANAVRSGLVRMEGVRGGARYFPAR